MTGKWDPVPKEYIPSTCVRPAKTRVPGTTPTWLIIVSAVAPGVAFIGGLIAGRLW